MKIFINSSQKFGKLRIKDSQEVFSGSEKKILWICDCGKEKLAPINKVISGATTRCGRCNEIPSEEMAVRKFGKLRIKDPQSIKTMSNKKTSWICDCGKEKLIQISCVTSGTTISCGRCNEISASEMSIRKFGKLKIKDPQSVTRGSHEKILWICDCGRETLAPINGILHDHITSCGRCNEISADEMVTRKFGKLKIKDPQNIFPGSCKKIWWVCDCGRKTFVSISLVLHNRTTSCGRCNEISSDQISKMKFGKLRIKDPQNMLCGSHNKVTWICDCGKEVDTIIHNVISGNTSSCGRCNEVYIDNSSQNKFGKLRIKNPKRILPGSNKKTSWVCDCGREKLIQINYVLSGHITSCGRCNEISSDEMAIRKFGRLRIKNPRSIMSGSHEKILWICDCGKEKLMPINSVIHNRIFSCGKCYEVIYDWYLKNKEKLWTLKCPIKPEDFPTGGMKPLEVITHVSKPFRWECGVCKRVYTPIFKDIRSAHCSLTCGCYYNRVSKGQKDVAEYIKSLGFDYILEHPVNKLKYDIFVPSKNLLIEYQGTKWHSMPHSKERDERKRQNALDHGYNFESITDIEWKKSGAQLITSILNKFKELIDH